MTTEKDGVEDRSMFFPGGRVGVLLIHGLGGTPVELRYIAKSLERIGCTVFCCQLAGHCGTPEELRRSTWQEWYASVEAAHDKLKEHCDIILAGGLSMGGILAIHLAQNRPSEVHGLLLYAPTLKLDGWSMPWHSVFLQYVRPTPIRLEIDLPEHEPYGIKDERVRRLVVSSMQSGAQRPASQSQLFTRRGASSARARTAGRRGRTHEAYARHVGYLGTADNWRDVEPGGD
jgi:carboxylesterase